MSITAPISARRVDALDAVLANFEQQEAEAAARQEARRRIVAMAEDGFLAEIDRIAAGMNPRLEPFGIRFRRAATEISGESTRFVVVAADRLDDILPTVSPLAFAILCDDPRARRFTILASGGCEHVAEPRHYADLLDLACRPLIIETQLAGYARALLLPRFNG